jgi:REP element-mobilizing transposase RayT
MATQSEISDPLLPDYFYHIYNRGSNGQKIFFQEKNYLFFLKRYAQYCSKYLDTFCYCLIPNHFHFVVRIKPIETILKSIIIDYENLPKGYLNILKKHNITFDADVNNLLQIPEDLKEKTTSWFVSNQLRRLFISYSKAIKTQEGTVGSLLEKPFKRKIVDSEKYLNDLICYVHRNPQHHQVYPNYQDYSYSSFQSLTSKKPTLLLREELLSRFNGKENFIDFHKQEIENWEKLQGLIIE